MQRPACLKAFTVVTYRSEEWSFTIIAVFGEIEIVTNALCCLRVNGETPFLPPLRTTFKESNPRFMWKSPTFRPARPSTLVTREPDLFLRNPGEAYVWSSKATDEAFSKEAVKMHCRPRVTRHEGTTKTAVSHE
jgi:hypothetical protein